MGTRRQRNLCRLSLIYLLLFTVFFAMAHFLTVFVNRKLYDCKQIPNKGTNHGTEADCKHH